MGAARDQSREMRHIDQEECADFIRNLPHASKVDDARVRAAAADDQLRTMLLSQFFQRVVVDRLSFLRDSIWNDLVCFAGKIQMMAVGEVSAMGQIQSENRIARLQYCR